MVSQSRQVGQPAKLDFWQVGSPRRLPRACSKEKHQTSGQTGTVRRIWAAEPPCENARVGLGTSGRANGVETKTSESESERAAACSENFPFPCSKMHNSQPQDTIQPKNSQLEMALSPGCPGDFNVFLFTFCQRSWSSMASSRLEFEALRLGFSLASYGAVVGWPGVET